MACHPQTRLKSDFSAKSKNYEIRRKNWEFFYSFQKCKLLFGKNPAKCALGAGLECQVKTLEFKNDLESNIFNHKHSSWTAWCFLILFLYQPFFSIWGGLYSCSLVYFLAIVSHRSSFCGWPDELKYYFLITKFILIFPT